MVTIGEKDVSFMKESTDLSLNLCKNISTFLSLIVVECRYFSLGRMLVHNTRLSP